MSSTAPELFPDEPSYEIEEQRSQELGAQVLHLFPRPVETPSYQLSHEELEELRARCRCPELRDPEVKKKFLEGLSGI